MMKKLCAWAKEWGEAIAGSDNIQLDIISNMDSRIALLEDEMKSLREEKLDHPGDRE